MSSSVEFLNQRAETWLPTVPDRSVQLIFADVPYFKVLAEDWDHQWATVEEYLAWLGEIMDELVRVLALNGSIYVCAGAELADLISVKVIRPRLRRLSEIVWGKRLAEYPPGDSRAGWLSRDTAILRQWAGQTERIIFAEHRGSDTVALGESGYAAEIADLRGRTFEPLRAYLNDERKAAGVSVKHVNECLGTATMAGHYFSSSQWALPTAPLYAKLRELFNRNGAGGFLRREYDELRREYEDLRRPFNVTSDVPFTDVWSYATVPMVPGRHPAEKPIAMLHDVLRASSRPGDMVLDCFSGRGTTACACVDLGRSFCGVEADADIFASAQDRIEKHASIKEGRAVEKRPQMAPIIGPLFE